MNPQPIPVIRQPIDAEVTVPGSKSLTNRAMLVAALADGRSTLTHALFSDDTEYFSEGLRRLGVPVDNQPDASRFMVDGQGGRIAASQADLFIGNAGTAARFLSAVVGLGDGAYRFDGVPAMRVRPMAALLDVLQQQGATVAFEGEDGFMPYTIHAHGLAGGTVSLSTRHTSQPLTALLMVAPCARQEVTIVLQDELVSEPYIDMTIRLMQDWGVEVTRSDDRFVIAAGQRYRAQPAYAIEPDASSASYFFATAALTGGHVRIPHLTQHSSQGDVGLVDLLAQMGCRVSYSDDSIELTGGERLSGGHTFDMNAISDTVPTLAAIAPFADGPIRIVNVEHIRRKETDRIHAVVTELRRLGATVDEADDGMTIHPGPLHGATVETYGDHRIAMSFAITGLKTPDVLIADPGCTAKTFPDFFDVLFSILPQ